MHTPASASSNSMTNRSLSPYLYAQHSSRIQEPSIWSCKATFCGMGLALRYRLEPICSSFIPYAYSNPPSPTTGNKGMIISVLIFREATQSSHPTDAGLLVPHGTAPSSLWQMRSFMYKFTICPPCLGATVGRSCRRLVVIGYGSGNSGTCSNGLRIVPHTSGRTTPQRQQLSQVVQVQMRAPSNINTLHQKVDTRTVVPITGSQPPSD